MRFQDSLKLTDIIGRANETEPHKVDACRGCPNCMGAIMMANRWSAELYAGKVDALVVTNDATLNHAQLNAPRFLCDDLHADGTVGQHHAVADLQFIDERRIG